MDTGEVIDTTMLTEQSEISPGPRPDQIPQDPAKQPSTEPVKKKRDEMTIDDLLLPRTITQRICKGVLPPNTSIHRDAALALTKSATVFISLLASEANSLTDKKTIQSADVIKALREIELGNVMQLGVLGEDGKRGGRVEREVEKWEGDVRGKRRGYREKVRARTTGDDTTELNDVNDATLNAVDENEVVNDEAGDQLREGLNGHAQTERDIDVNGKIYTQADFDEMDREFGEERKRARIEREAEAEIAKITPYPSSDSDDVRSVTPEYYSDEEEEQPQREEEDIEMDVRDVDSSQVRLAPNGRVEVDMDSGEDSD